MRFLKSLSLNRRQLSVNAPGINYTTEGNVVMQTTKSLLVPKGAQNERPYNAEEGLIRYNTDETNFEVYQDGTWKPIRFREPVTITNQNLGNGDGTETVFGPLDSGDAFYPVPIAEANILVFVENVFQLPVSNYSLLQSSGGSLTGPNAPYLDGWYIKFGTPVPSGKPVNVLHNFDK